jgi:hypothetical protein
MLIPAVRRGSAAVLGQTARHDTIQVKYTNLHEGDLMRCPPDEPAGGREK